MKYILIIFLIYLFIRWFLRRVAPLFVASYIKKMTQQDTQSRSHAKTKRKEGEVDVKQITKKEKKIDKDLGEYVHYEEIK
ncbi:MAG: DUF4834 family protein [Prevotellaceae bacterium]|jgi:hypothetical protein|nr:DUF4834 family protein [Prevotellaceae bacterium]